MYMPILYSMVSRKINLNDHSLKVATLNLHNSPVSYLERAAAAVQEAAENRVEVLLIQELLFSERKEVTELFQSHGYTHSFISDPLESKKAPTGGSSTAVFSSIPFKTTRELNLTALPGAHKAAVAVLDHEGYEIHAISAHLVWGGDNGHSRLRQAMILNEYANRYSVNSRVLMLAGGTFNDIPEADSVRYLKGLKSSDDNSSAFWVDVTENSPIYNVPTTRHDTKWGIAAAKSTGIKLPSMVPERCVDYLFVQGWVYGSAGMPFKTERFGVHKTVSNLDISDHYGVMTNLWLPVEKY